MGIKYGALGIGNWGWARGQEDKGTRRIGDKGKDLFQVLTSCPLVPLSPSPPAPLLPAPSLLLQSYICSAECGKEFFVINLVYLENRSFVATVLKVKRSLTKNWDGERWRN
ncbi:hypothetical protein A6V25_03465 [Nostoc sp. ATCC 53789]|nr:hypothetical protein A6V25_03465 [Nostoc sp. ATCC 53789]